MKSYKIIKHFGDGSTQEVMPEGKPSLPSLIQLLKYEDDPAIQPSCVAIEVYINDWPKLNNVLGMDSKFLPDGDVLVNIYNTAKPKKRAVSTVSNFFVLTRAQYKEILLQKTEITV